MAELPVSYPNQQVPFEQIPESNAGVGVGASVVGPAAGAFGQLAQSMRKADMANKLSVLDMQLSKASGDARIAAEQADPAQAGNVYDAAIGQYRQKYVDSINDPELQREAALRLNAQASNDIPSVHYRAVQKMADVSKDMLANDLQIQGQNYLNADTPAHQMEAEQRIRQSFDSRVGILFTQDQANTLADEHLRTVKTKAAEASLNNIAAQTNYSNLDESLKKARDAVSGTNITDPDAERSVIIGAAEAAAGTGKTGETEAILSRGNGIDPAHVAALNARAKTRYNEIQGQDRQNKTDALLGDIRHAQQNGSDLSDNIQQINKAADDGVISEHEASTLTDKISEYRRAIVRANVKDDLENKKASVYGIAMKMMQNPAVGGGAQSIPADGVSVQDLEGNTHHLTREEIINQAADAQMATFDTQYATALQSASNPIARDNAYRGMMAKKIAYMSANQGQALDRNLSQRLSGVAKVAVNSIANAKDGKIQVSDNLRNAFKDYRTIYAQDPTIANKLAPDATDQRWYQYAMAYYEDGHYSSPDEAMMLASRAVANNERKAVAPIEDSDLKKFKYENPFPDAKNAGQMRQTVFMLANAINSDLSGDKSKALQVAKDQVQNSHFNVLGYMVPQAQTLLNPAEMNDGAQEVVDHYAQKYGLTIEQSNALTVRPLGNGTWMLVDGENGMEPVQHFVTDGLFSETNISQRAKDYRARTGLKPKYNLNEDPDKNDPWWLKALGAIGSPKG